MCTTAFSGLADLVWGALTERDAAKGVIEHPIGGIPAADVQTRVEAVWPELERWLSEVGFDGGG